MTGRQAYIAALKELKAWTDDKGDDARFDMIPALLQMLDDTREQWLAEIATEKEREEQRKQE